MSTLVNGQEQDNQNKNKYHLSSSEDVLKSFHTV